MIIVVTLLTCSEKRDLPEFFMNIEILAWIDSPVYAEYNGASFKEKILIASRVMAIFIHTGR